MIANVLKKEKIASGHWLELINIFYKDSYGKERCWESVSRANSSGAVVILAILEKSERVILVRQFRPPTNGFTIEFPAGLIDKNETPVDAALRELKEETGYSGKIINVGSPAFSSPGLSSEQVRMVIVSIDEDAEENQTLQTNFDSGECVETFLVELKDLSSFIKEREKEGDFLDAKVMTFLTALSICTMK